MDSKIIIGLLLGGAALAALVGARKGKPTGRITRPKRPGRIVARLPAAVKEIKEEIVETLTPIQTKAREVAGLLGIRPETAEAIMVVESRGASDAFRFEPHVFHKATKDAYRAQVPFTPGGGCRGKQYHSCLRAETNWAAFERAARYDKDAAVRASSWGAFQVLDPLYRGGAKNATRWLQRWDEEDRWDLSVELLLGWFAGNKAAKAEVQAAEDAGGTAESWIPFVLRYNGAGATKPGQDYHKKLAAAFAAAAGR